MIFGERSAENGTRMVKSFADEPAEFVAWAVKENAPDVVGVPEMLPAESRVRPAGSEPERRVHVMGVEPIAERAAEYMESSVPSGRLVVTIMGAILVVLDGVLLPDDAPERGYTLICTIGLVIEDGLK